MTIRMMDCNCDECATGLGDGAIIYCSSCFKELQQDIEEHQKKIDQWLKVVRRISSYVAGLQGKEANHE